MDQFTPIDPQSGLISTNRFMDSNPDAIPTPTPTPVRPAITMTVGTNNRARRSVRFQPNPTCYEAEPQSSGMSGLQCRIPSATGFPVPTMTCTVVPLNNMKSTNVLLVLAIGVVHMAASMTGFLYLQSHVLLLLSLGMLLVNVGLLCGALYHLRELLIAWLIYYTFLFIFCVFIRLPSIKVNWFLL